MTAMPNEKDLDVSYEMVKAAIINGPKHEYWGAGEPDCPQDIKAPNGELHTLRCKHCDDPKFPICSGGTATAAPDTEAEARIRRGSHLLSEDWDKEL